MSRLLINFVDSSRLVEEFSNDKLIKIAWNNNVHIITIVIIITRVITGPFGVSILFRSLQFHMRINP